MALLVASISLQPDVDSGHTLHKQVYVKSNDFRGCKNDNFELKKGLNEYPKSMF